MSKISSVPDAWEDDWETAADKLPTPPLEPRSEPAPEQKKVSSKVTKAQRRAQQAELNRQLWAEAEGPRETNYFLETRPGVVVLPRAEFKPPPILLSRKGPAKNPKPPSDGVDNLSGGQNESSSDEDEAAQKILTLAERQAQAAKEREEKQRKYEERRQELFGSNSGKAHPSGAGSGTSSPGDLTPPGSRAATPNRGRGKGRRTAPAAAKDAQQKRDREKDLYDPSYTVKPDSVYISRPERGTLEAKEEEVRPIRAPRGPDGSGRGGFGFASHGGKSASANPVNGTT